MTTILNSPTTKKPSLSISERLQQTYVIGSTGVGKSTLLLNMILHDIKTDHGVCVLDPHGDLITDIIARMDSRLDDVVLLSLTNPYLPFGLNIFHCQNPHDPISVQMTVSTVINVFEKVFGLARATMGRQLTYLRALIYLFIHNPELTALDVSTILNADTKYDALRRRLVANLPRTPGYNFTREFWTEGFSMRAKRAFVTQDNELFGTLWKFEEMTSDLLYPFFCQNNTIDFADLMAQRKIVLCKMTADQPDVTSLVGSVLIAQILHAGYVRKQRSPFYVYADEFQNFATYDFARLFAEARKFQIAVTISHQTTNQIEPAIKETCLQAGNIFVFRVSAGNSRELAGNFDNTPPPGEIIYEKQMRKASLTKAEWQWDPPEKEEEDQRLLDEWERIRALQEPYKKYTLGHVTIGDVWQIAWDNYNVEVHKKYKRKEAVQFYYDWYAVAQELKQINHIDFINNPFIYWIAWGGTPQWHSINYEAIGGDWQDTKYLCMQIQTEIPSIPHTIKQHIAKLARQEVRIKEQISYCRKTHYKSLPRVIYSGWYEPIPVVEPAELRIARQLGVGVDIVDNVRYSARQGPSPYTSSEMTDRIANKLAHLPNYTACIKTPTGEFVVTTSLPRPAVHEQEFRDRVRFIQRNNLRLGYLSRREDVEQEIMEREPLVPDFSSQPIQPRHPSSASPMVVPPPLPQSRKKKRQPITMQG